MSDGDKMEVREQTAGYRGQVVGAGRVSRRRVLPYSFCSRESGLLNCGSPLPDHLQIVELLPFRGRPPLHPPFGFDFPTSIFAPYL